MRELCNILHAMDAFHELGSDVVVKPIFGSLGRGMTRVSDPDLAYRVFVIGDEAVAAMVRRGDSWKTNVAQGAEAIPLALNDELRELSVRAARALGADYAGGDLLPLTDGGYTVIELNGIPGWRGRDGDRHRQPADRFVGAEARDRPSVFCAGDHERSALPLRAHRHAKF